MRSIIVIAILFLQSSILSSQSRIKPLHIGDTMPNILLRGFMESPEASIGMNDLRGKLVIFDMWNIWCAACIGGMPKLDSLQQEFKDSIKIILVTPNSRTEVEKLFKKIKRNVPSLSMMVSDTILNELFPHVTVPHQIWIDANSIVKYITEGHNASTENIRKALNREPLSLHFKNEALGFETTKPLLTEGNGRLGYHLRYYSILMNRIDEYSGAYFKLFEIDSSDAVIRSRMVNLPILDYFRFGFGNLIPDGLTDIYSKELFDNRIIIETGDPSRLYAPINDADKDHWNSMNLYSYESVIPLCDINEAYSFLQADINKFFPFYGKVEKRIVDCLVLKRISKTDKIKSSGGKPEFMRTNKSLIARNVSVESFIHVLANLNKGLATPFINGTSYLWGIDISIATNMTDINDLRRALKKWGLDLVKERRSIDMLIIKQKSTN